MHPRTVLTAHRWIRWVISFSLTPKAVTGYNTETPDPPLAVNTRPGRRGWRLYGSTSGYGRPVSSRHVRSPPRPSLAARSRLMGGARNAHPHFTSATRCGCGKGRTSSSSSFSSCPSGAAPQRRRPSCTRKPLIAQQPVNNWLSRGRRHPSSLSATRGDRPRRSAGSSNASRTSLPTEFLRVIEEGPSCYARPLVIAESKEGSQRGKCPVPSRTGRNVVTGIACKVAYHSSSPVPSV